MQQVPAILQATEYVSVFEGQLADRALDLVVALAAHIAFRRHLTGLEDELGSRLAQQTLPLVRFEFFTELGLRVVARTEDLSDHLRVLAVHASTLASLPLKNTNQCSRNISLKRSLLMHWASPAAIVGSSFDYPLARSLTDVRHQVLATAILNVTIASLLTDVEFDLAHVYGTTVNGCSRNLSFNLLLGRFQEATLRTNHARALFSALIDDNISSRLHSVDSSMVVVAEGSLGYHALPGRCRSVATDLGELARRNGLVRLARAGVAALRGAGGRRLRLGLARRVRDGLRLGRGVGALARAFALVRVAPAGLLLLR